MTQTAHPLHPDLPGAAPAQAPAARDLIGLQIGELWGRGRLDLVDRLYTPATIDHMPVPGQTGDVSGLAAVVAEFRRAIPDMVITVHALIGAGDRAADIWTLTGTHRGDLPGLPASGSRVRFCGIDMIRAAGGRITDIWHVEEMGRMVADMGGALPPVLAPLLCLPGRSGAGGDEAAPPPVIRPVATGADGLATVDLGRRLLDWLFGSGSAPAPALAADARDHTCPPGRLPGLAGAQARARFLRKLCPGPLVVEDGMAEGPFAALRFTIAGCVPGMAGLRVDGTGAVTDLWLIPDLMRLPGLRPRD